MFQQLKQVDAAFQMVKWWSLGIVSASIIGTVGMGIYGLHALEQAKESIYVVGQDQAFRAYSQHREEMVAIEGVGHVKRLHQLLFSLSPDEGVINRQLEEAFYLGDGSLKFHVDNLRESGYYKQVLSANISQILRVDSVWVDESRPHYPFRFYGKQEIIRASSRVVRSLRSTGTLRVVQRSEKNPHGLLVENWEIVENRDLGTYGR